MCIVFRYFYVYASARDDKILHWLLTVRHYTFRFTIKCIYYILYNIIILYSHISIRLSEIRDNDLRGGGHVVLIESSHNMIIIIIIIKPVRPARAAQRCVQRSLPKVIYYYIIKITIFLLLLPFTKKKRDALSEIRNMTAASATVFISEQHALFFYNFVFTLIFF
jgi:hypothetical protein